MINTYNKYGKNHYKKKYLGNSFQRLYSYRQQLFYTLRSSPESILIIGKGDGLVEEMLKRFGVSVTSLDIDKDLSPEIIGSVEEIPCNDKIFDVTLCCQVLEHLPFSSFVPSLREILRVTRGHLILSLPDIRRFISIRIKVPKVHIDLQTSLFRIIKRNIPNDRVKMYGHYWEIGFKETQFRSLKTAIDNSGWVVLETHRVSDLPWHTFFYCGTEK